MKGTLTLLLLVLIGCGSTGTTMTLGNAAAGKMTGDGVVITEVIKDGEVVKRIQTCKTDCVSHNVDGKDQNRSLESILGVIGGILIGIFL